MLSAKDMQIIALLDQKSNFFEQLFAFYLSMWIIFSILVA